MTDDQRRSFGFSALWENISKSAMNALEIARAGRLSPEQHAPYTVVRRERVYRLRHYQRSASAPDTVDAPLVLVPPLMVTAEIYDIDPSASTVSMLTSAGIDTWIVDFGSPEEEEGGLARTLDDHVIAVSQAIDHVRATTGSDVHLAGYSQGGMFCYQTAAYRESQGLKSLITFGSPVDIHRNMLIRDDLAMRVIDSISGLVKKPLEMIEGLPGAISSRGFRVLSAGKEFKQFIDFVTNLHDREALMRGESSRKFLHGEGFVAWPGPALRAFFEQFVVDNRLSQGGFVVEGRTLTLADVRCPILFFVGERDEFARPPSVRAIREAAPNAKAYEVSVRAGHFGLVVGSMSAKVTWPTTIQWIRWLEDKGLRPTGIRGSGETVRPEAIEDVIEANFEDVEYNVRLLYDNARGAANGLKRRLGGVSDTLIATFDNLRYQVPRLAKLERIEAETKVSVGLALSEQARAHPDETFFLFHGRAHTYGAADRRVDYIVKGLIACGIEPGTHVGVMMQARPTYLSLVTALSRLGAVAVLISPEQKRLSLRQALELGAVRVLITDPERAQAGRAAFSGKTLVLGSSKHHRPVPEGVVDMEEIDPNAVILPSWYEPNPGRARDLAMILFTSDKDEQPRAARITNRRWAVAAYGAASTSTLTGKDTVYCVMPLDHAAGLLVSVGGALVGGARLALADGFDPAVFWTEVRRYGATVIYYAGEMCRALVDAPSTPADKKHPVRLFAGSGMRIDVWKRLVERFDVGVLEFYATTEGNAVLANVSGHKVGALGKPLPGTSDLALVAYDFERDELVRDKEQRLVRCYSDQPGMLLARIEAGHPMASFDGYVDERESHAHVLKDAFAPGDAWFMTGDILRVDADGVYWFVDRASDMIRTPGGPISSRHIEDVLYELPEIQHAVVTAVADASSQQQLPAASVVVREGYTLDATLLARHIERRLDLDSRPQFIVLRSHVDMSVGFRPTKASLRSAGIPLHDPRTLRYDPDRHTYAPTLKPSTDVHVEATSSETADKTLSDSEAESV
jgi:putative long chain acyl-CoA synthase